MDKGLADASDERGLGVLVEDEPEVLLFTFDEVDPPVKGDCIDALVPFGVVLPETFTPPLNLPRGFEPDLADIEFVADKDGLGLTKVRLDVNSVGPLAPIGFVREEAPRDSNRVI